MKFRTKKLSQVSTNFSSLLILTLLTIYHPGKLKRFFVGPSVVVPSVAPPPIPSIPQLNLQNLQENDNLKPPSKPDSIPSAISPSNQSDSFASLPNGTNGTRFSRGLRLSQPGQPSVGLTLRHSDRGEAYFGRESPSPSLMVLAAHGSSSSPTQARGPNPLTIPGFSLGDDTKSVRSMSTTTRQGVGSNNDLNSTSAMRRFRGEGLKKEYWMPDEASKECTGCQSVFTAFRRKHHCRVCGQIFCSRW